MVRRSRLEVIVARSKNGEAIGERGRSPSARKKLRKFIRQREKAGDLDEWRRGKAVLGYIEGQRVVDLAEQFDVTRGSVNRWLQWYETLGIAGLVTESPPGPPSKLSESQRAELTALVEAGPIAAGYASGVWTGPMRRKLFLILDNGPCHNLKPDGKAWLHDNRHRIELFRLPPYSPNLNPIEGAWKETKKRTTHNRFFRTTDERDAALCFTFDTFAARPALLAGQVARFL